MKNPILFALTVQALLVMPANAQAPRIHTDIVADTTTGNRVVTHMAAGGGWSTLIVLINLGTTPANYTLKFFGDSGSPQEFNFKNPATQQVLGNQSVLSGNLPLGGEVYIKARDQANTTTTGWALIDPSSIGDIGAEVVFTYDLNGQQAIVPVENASTQKFTIPFDNTGGGATGIALANPHANPVTVNVVFRDMNGATLHSDQIQMQPMEHTSFVLSTPYPSLAAQAGTAYFSTDSAADAIAGLGILINSVGAYTTIFALAAQ
jgi:hypothetical protein